MSEAVELVVVGAALKEKGEAVAAPPNPPPKLMPKPPDEAVEGAALTGGRPPKGCLLGVAAAERSSAKGDAEGAKDANGEAAAVAAP